MNDIKRRDRAIAYNKLWLSPRYQRRVKVQGFLLTTISVGVVAFLAHYSLTGIENVVSRSLRIDNWAAIGLLCIAGLMVGLAMVARKYSSMRKPNLTKINVSFEPASDDDEEQTQNLPNADIQQDRHLAKNKQ